jgi:dephospho-CoA kinase
MLKVGLTGGVASGKTTVLNLFRDLGAHIIDTDMIAREVVTPRLPAWEKIVEHFGRSYLNPDLTLNRKLLRKTVFSDPGERKLLENIVHPEVLRKMHRRIEQMNLLHPENTLVVDVPLLIEIGLEDEFNKVVVVYVDREIQIKRVMVRDGISRDEALKLLSAQISLDEKMKFADFVINNQGTVEETKLAVRKVFEQLKVL